VTEDDVLPPGVVEVVLEEPVVGGTVVGSVVVVDGATPAGLTTRNCDTLFTAAAGGFEMGEFFGTKAMVMSSPFLSGMPPKFDVTRVPVLADGDGHVFTWTNADREPHLWPFVCVTAGPGTSGRVVVVVELVVDVAAFFFEVDFTVVVVVVDEDVDVVVEVVVCLTGLPGYRRLVWVSTTPSGLRNPNRSACLPSYRLGVVERCG
jgi:hypothetical protein